MTDAVAPAAGCHVAPRGRRVRMSIGIQPGGSARRGHATQRAAWEALKKGAESKG